MAIMDEMWGTGLHDLEVFAAGTNLSRSRLASVPPTAFVSIDRWGGGIQSLEELRAARRKVRSAVPASSSTSLGEHCRIIVFALFTWDLRHGGDALVKAFVRAFPSESD